MKIKVWKSRTTKEIYIGLKQVRVSGCALVMFYNKLRNHRCHTYRAVYSGGFFSLTIAKRGRFLSSCFGNYEREVVPCIYQLGIKNAKSETMKQEICFSNIIISIQPLTLLFFNIQQCGIFPAVAAVYS